MEGKAELCLSKASREVFPRGDQELADRQAKVYLFKNKNPPPSCV